MASKRSTDVAERKPGTNSRAYIVPDGRLPLTEFCFDRAGAASPFGDDLALPMPISELTYVHPTPDAPPAHL